jgi:hypothetical protein
MDFVCQSQKVLEFEHMSQNWTNLNGIQTTWRENCRCEQHIRQRLGRWRVTAHWPPRWWSRVAQMPCRTDITAVVRSSAIWSHPITCEWCRSTKVDWSP